MTKKEKEKQRQVRYRAKLETKEKRREYQRSYGAKWREKNRERIREYHNRRYNEIPAVREAHAKGMRRAYLNRKYGLTEAQFSEMLEAQGGKCAICPERFSNKVRGSGAKAVDHDHATGAIRGILCWGCNQALGNVKDSIETLRNMIEYLSRHNARRQDD